MHLIHPALLHFSVAFLVIGGLAEAWGLFAGRERAVWFGGVMVLFGTVSLVPTTVSGFLAINSLTLGPEANAAADIHERIGIAILGLFLVLLMWKGWHRGTIPAAQRTSYAVVLLAGVALVVYGAMLGGRLVYVHGVGVGVS